MEYLNLEGIEGISAEAFQNQRPYPWANIPGTLTPQGYERLRETLPDVSTFIPKIGHTLRLWAGQPRQMHIALPAGHRGA